MGQTKLIKSISEMKEIVKDLKIEGLSIGFVPTMGYLHEGHISLMECSKRENDITIVSIFVNPIQFGKNEDFDKYPRDIERDLKICKEVGVNYLFNPSQKEMYPKGYSTFVIVEGLTEKLCGAFREGHFRGVTTVVNKLFNIVKPDRAYFGKKDYQQLKVIERMVKDLNMDIEIIGCPIVREADGLALSSRNKYLSPEERKSALSISKALFKAKKKFEAGETDPYKLIKLIKNVINSYPYTRIQYVEIVDSETLEPKTKVEKGDIIAVAVFVGDTRLIDNIEL
ncbi:MAG: pantoate--beta-alanine ligase [Persephonella sp.]|nr:MAG: pantoate--beta-alanine ligase [Persephonella sp.]